MMQKLNPFYGIDFKKGLVFFSLSCIALGLEQAL